MATLILKDLMNVKKVMTFVLIYGLIMIFGFQNIPNAALTASTIAISYMFMVQACMRDDKNKSEIILNSLPLSRRTIVSAKYLSVFLYTALGLVSYLFAYVLVQLTGVPIHIYPLTLVSITGVVTAAIVMSALYYPVYFKFGYPKSNIFGMIIFFTFFFSRGVVHYVIKRLADLPLPQSLESLYFWVSQQTASGLAVIILFSGMIFLGLSYVLSVRFYSTREF